MKVTPVMAFCAVGPDGAIDIDLLRRNAPSCQNAAKNVHGHAWPVMAGRGWRIVPVRIVAAGEPEEGPVAPPAPRPSLSHGRAKVISVEVRRTREMSLTEARGGRVLVTFE